MYRTMRVFWAVGLVFVLACSDDDTNESPDSGVKDDTGADSAVADMAHKDGAGVDGTQADMGQPDAAIVTPGWAVTLGGKQLDDPKWGRGVKVDSKGNIYLLGNFKTDITFGSTTLTTKGDIDGWLAKLDSMGKVLWAIQVGGAADQKGQLIAGMCLDAKDQPHIVGAFAENVTLGSKAYTTKAVVDFYVAKLSATDGKVVWSQVGVGPDATSQSALRDCFFDSAGSLVAGGYFKGSYTFGSTSLKTTGTDSDALILKLAADGSKVELAAAFGGADDQWIEQMGQGPAGEIYAAGDWEASITHGGTTTKAVDGAEMWVAQLSSAGAVNWLTTGVGKGKDFIFKMVVDSKGSAYLGGQIGGDVTTPAAPFKIGSFSLPIGTNREMFLAKVDKTGKVLWAKESHYTSAMGGWALETIRGIALDKSDRLIATGQAYADMDFFGKKLVPPNISGFHAVLGQISTDGSAEWAVSYGHPSSKYVFGNAVAVDPSGDIILVGIYKDKVTVGGKTFTSQGSYDIFVHKVTPK